MRDDYPFYLANEPANPNTDLEVTDKYTGEVASRVAMASAADIDRAIAAAEVATDPMRKMAPYERQAVLNHCVKRITERFEELAMTLCIEAGKPIKDSRGEVSRLIDTFRVAVDALTGAGDQGADGHDGHGYHVRRLSEYLAGGLDEA